jgi:hypothetical protein
MIFLRLFTEKAMELSKLKTLLASTALVGFVGTAQGQAPAAPQAPTTGSAQHGIVSTIFMSHTNRGDIRVGDGAGHIATPSEAKSVGALLASDSKVAAAHGRPQVTVMTFFTPPGGNRPTHAFACWAATDMPGQPRHHAQLQNFAQGGTATVDVNYVNGVCIDLDPRTLRQLGRVETPAAPTVATPAGGQRYGYMPVQK